MKDNENIEITLDDLGDSQTVKEGELLSETIRFLSVGVLSPENICFTESIEESVAEHNNFEIEEYIMDKTVYSLSLAQGIMVEAYNETIKFLRTITKNLFHLPSELREVLAGQFSIGRGYKIREENKEKSITGLLYSVTLNPETEETTPSMVLRRRWYERTFEYYIKSIDSQIEKFWSVSKSFSFTREQICEIMGTPEEGETALIDPEIQSYTFGDIRSYRIADSSGMITYEYNAAEVNEQLWDNICSKMY